MNEFVAKHGIISNGNATISGTTNIIGNLNISGNTIFNSGLTATSFNLITGLSSSLPLINATPAIVGTSTLVARQDHVHPTDTSRQASLNGTGFMKISGTTISYDNSTYLTIVNASNTYLPLPISLTYSALYALKTANTLVVGQRYIINDYQTIHTITNTSNTNTSSIEPLLVTALTPNKLANECYSTLFPQDIIYYNIESDQNMVYGCTKGYIYRRIDTLKNNDIGFDYRNVKFRRWQIDVTTSHVDGNEPSFTIGSVVLQTGTANIYLKISNTQAAFSETGKWKLFEWQNLTYTSPFTDNWNIDGNYFYIPVNNSNYFDYYLFSTAPTLLRVQSIYDNIYKNKFSGNSSAVIDNSNTVFFGDSFNSNTIGDVSSYNTIGNYFSYNTIGNYFSYNTIGDGFNYNTIVDNFNYNNSVDFTSSTYVYMAFNKELFVTQGCNQYLKYYDDTTLLVILPANT